jgi:hypothetical protein
MHHPSLYLCQSWGQTEKPVSFEAQTTNHRALSFEIQTKKLSRWFWALNNQTISVNFEAQTKKIWVIDFEAKSEKTATTGFEGKPEKIIATGFETKPEKTVTVVLRSNHWQTVPVVLRSNHCQTVDLGFEAQPRKSRSSSSRARCRPHIASPDLPIVRPPSIRPVPDHPGSSAPGLILLPWSLSLSVMPYLSHAHHETNQHDSPHDTKIKVKQPKCLKFKFKPCQVNDSSQSN